MFLTENPVEKGKQVLCGLLYIARLAERLSTDMVPSADKEISFAEIVEWRGFFWDLLCLFNEEINDLSVARRLIRESLGANAVGGFESVASRLLERCQDAILQLGDQLSGVFAAHGRAKVDRAVEVGDPHRPEFEAALRFFWVARQGPRARAARVSRTHWPRA